MSGAYKNSEYFIDLAQQDQKRKAKERLEAMKARRYWFSRTGSNAPIIGKICVLRCHVLGSKLRRYLRWA